MNIFLCLVPFHYFVFKSIYENLKTSYFAIPPLHDRILTDEFGGGLSERGQYDYIEGFLNRKKIAIIDYGEKTAEKLAKFVDANCKNVIIPHWFSGINLIRNSRIVRVIYGLANKESSTYSVRNNLLMDLVLTYGPSSANRFLDVGIPSQPIGNPIFDGWFNNEYESEDYEYIKTRIEDKPTILYLPTADKFSRIEKFIGSIISLAKKYNIVIKLHHSTFIGESNRLIRLLSQRELIVLGDYIDPLAVYKIADIILTENSGAIYDALLLEKPVIILDASLGTDGHDIYDERDSNNVVQKSEIVPSTDNPKELECLVKDNIGKRPYLNDGLRQSLFFKTDGCAGKRAAEFIMNNKEYPAIPALEKYDRVLEYISDPKQRYIIQKEKNRFLQCYYPDQIKKPSLLSKIFRRF